MNSGDSLWRKNYFWFICSIVLLVAIFLVWAVRGRIAEFHEYHHHIAFESITGISNEVSRFVEEHNHRVKLFAKYELELIRAVAADPNNEEIYQVLKRQIEEFFPNHFAFTVASSDGVPFFEDFDGLVAESCEADIKQFAREHFYHPYVHPNNKGYHFDVMAHYGDEEGVLFVSFHVDILGTILRSAQSLGHNLMLLYPSRSNLIEVVSEGARVHLDRDDYRLSDDETDRIIVQIPVMETRWDAADMHDADLFSDYERRLSIEASVIFSVFLIAGVFMIFRLRREETQRQKVERQKKELMGVITHELRTPASAVHGALQLIKRNTANTLSVESKSLLTMAFNNTHRLLTLVSDFLDLDKYESGQLKMDLSDNELVDIVNQAIENNQTYAEQFGVSYRINDTTVDVKVRCDVLRIEQVLSNFLSNAAKYGGESDIIEILINKPSINTVRVSVIDHGLGVPAEIQSKIFEKFVMSESRKNAKVRSSGLGLSIAKAIIEEHGGEIGFNTGQEKGSTFYFELPVVIDKVVGS